eukprot:TRINITY_DN17030_c2_g1_i1.p1 TRINITY_DN17030_c2_g1~~TRINITY_DN17030_c2_g1_i1.p1  ORF type:complete len:411 (+),score=153.64 TRINITY_DN17030_c2_g1_i1:28-1233(+)
MQQAQQQQQHQMPHGVPSEPPPLLSTDYNRVPLEALSVNHVPEGEAAKMHKAKLVKQKHAELMALEGMIRQSELSWGLMMSQVSQGVHTLQKQNEGDAAAFRGQLMDVVSSVRCLEQSVETHMLMKDLPTASAHITCAMNTTNADIIIDSCAKACAILEKYHPTTMLPEHLDLPQGIKQLLVSCGRNELAARGTNPVPALIAQCERLCGQTYMEQDNFEQASRAFLRAVELVNTEEGPAHWVAKELVMHYHAAQQKAISMVDQQSPSTPDALSARRKHFEMGGSQTPPPRKASEMEVFTRSGAATPSTGRGKSSWDSPAGSYQFSFGRSWAMQGAAETSTPSPAPPRVERKCHHCNAVSTRERKVKLCSKCKKVCFCSQECQTASWEAGHSEVCEEAATAA